MIRRGKHAAPRPKGREKRRFGRAVPLALALVLVMAGLAWANHDVEFSSAVGGTTVTAAPGGTAAAPAAGSVTAGATVDLTATSSLDGNVNFLQIHQCLARDREAGGNNVVVPHVPLPVEACQVVNTEFGNTDGVWHLRAQVAPPAEDPPERLEALFAWSTTDAAPSTVAGFRAQRNPGPGQHPDGQRYIELTVVAPTGGDGHPGCKGIENAYNKVTNNHGSTKSNGKGAQALEAVADKLGCDLNG